VWIGSGLAGIDGLPGCCDSELILGRDTGA
jgi:hypothetical protein